MSGNKSEHKFKFHSETIGVLDHEEYKQCMRSDSCVYFHLKRVFDFWFATVALVILCIPLLIVMLAIYIDDPGPVLFKQHRVGLNGKIFKIYKFRSMKIDINPDLSTGEIKNPDAWITRVGKIIRSYSIDELPQLFNVLIGNMSLVGPRPLILKECDMHEMRNRYGVYSVRPGLTGLAQIKGRDLATAEQKIYWDVKYLESFGFLCDIMILLKTVPKVLKRVDVVEGMQKK